MKRRCAAVSIAALLLLIALLSSCGAEPQRVAEVELDRAASWFSDFAVINDKLDIYCDCTFINNTEQAQRIRVRADFSEDVALGLVKHEHLIGANSDGETEFTVARGRTEVELVFRDDFGGTAQKTNRLLPPITVEVLEETDKGNSEA